MAKTRILEQGSLSFTIESRIIRELGERLVKQPEIALLELVKNSYDADATICALSFQPSAITVRDNGVGMTLAEFKYGWMRIGTSAKEARTHTQLYQRPITGEKGIGRFAVRFLGRELTLHSVAVDDDSGEKTVLTATFNWPEFDRNLDLGNVKVPFVLEVAEPEEPVGTTLTIEQLRPGAKVDFRLLRTSSLTVVTPYQSLLNLAPSDGTGMQKGQLEDPGFRLELGESEESKEDVETADVASEILKNYVLRAVLEVSGKRISLVVYAKGEDEPVLTIVDEVEDLVGLLFADIRFFPQRGGTFRNMSVNGQKARAWVKEHSGVAVFDRAFRVYPYGTPGDDWLHLTADTAVNLRNPRSSVAQKHLLMDEAVRLSTQENYMLSIPHNAQLVGVVRVSGQRSKDQGGKPKGLLVSADREGFLHNDAYLQMEDLVRGAIEAIAYIDREIQLRKKADERKRLLSELRRETEN